MNRQKWKQSCFCPGQEGVWRESSYTVTHSLTSALEGHFHSPSASSPEHKLPVSAEHIWAPHVALYFATACTFVFSAVMYWTNIIDPTVTVCNPCRTQGHTRSSFYAVHVHINSVCAVRMHTVQLLPLVLPGHRVQTLEFRVASAQECHMSTAIFSAHDQFHRPIRETDFSHHQTIRTHSEEPPTLQFSGYQGTFTCR